MWIELTKADFEVELDALEVMDTVKKLCKANTGLAYRNTQARMNTFRHYLKNGAHKNDIIATTSQFLTVKSIYRRGYGHNKKYI